MRFLKTVNKGKVRKYQWAGMILVLMFSCLFGCQVAQEKTNEVFVQEDSPEALDIFLVGDGVTVLHQSDNTRSEYYTTMMTVGEFDALPTVFGEEGFVFYDALQKYEQQTGIEIRLHWYRYPELMEEALETLSETEKPDLILTNFTSKADFYQYMQQGMFYDVTDYAEQEGVYTGNQYYNIVLEAGKLNGKQYILPIMFNIDTVMGSEENLRNSGLYLENMENHSDMMNLILKAQQKQTVDEVIGQFVSGVTYYTPHILYAAAGEEWIDYETGEIHLDEERFKKMAAFTKSFLYEQFGTLKSGEKLSWADTKHMKVWRAVMGYMEDYLNKKGCIVEGGSSFQTFLHSAMTQAWYYESRYTDLGETFTVMAMPGENGGTTAHVSYFGGVLSTTKYPKASYDLIRYLMDQEFFYGFGISVNCCNAERALEDLTSFEYVLRPGLQSLKEDGTPYENKSDYAVHPMSYKTKEQLKQMLEKVDRVSLPNWPVFEILWEQLESYSKGEITVEEAYQKSCEYLQAYAAYH